MIAVWVGSSFAEIRAFSHTDLAIVVARLAGAAVGRIAGILKATVGAHEVITTIMLNWIAYWIGACTWSGSAGPLQNERRARA